MLDSSDIKSKLNIEYDLKAQAQWEFWKRQYKEIHPHCEKNGYGPGALILSQTLTFDELEAGSQKIVIDPKKIIYAEDDLLVLSSAMNGLKKVWASKA